MNLLKSHNRALCMAETEERVTPDIVTGDFAYYRYRKPTYTGEERKAMIEAIERTHRRRARRLRLLQARRNSRGSAVCGGSAARSVRLRLSQPLR